MGIISEAADACRRTLAFVTGRMQPSYSRPAAAPADALMQDTNSADDMRNARKHVAEGSPARTRPVSGEDQPTRPSPAVPSLNGRYGVMPNLDRSNDTSHPGAPRAVTADDAGHKFGYGIVSEASARIDQPRPGAGANVKPEPMVGGKRE